MSEALSVSGTAASVSTLPRRVAVTAAVPVALLALRTIDLPLLDPEVLRMVVGPAGARGGLLSPAALHLTPFLSAYLLVELVALAHPGLRPLRVGSVSGRLRLTRAAWLVGAGLAAIQGWGIATYLQTLTSRYGMPALEPGLAAAAVVALTLVAGALVTAWGAVLISWHGVGNGFAVLLAVDAVVALARGARLGLRGGIEVSDTAILVGLALLVVVPLAVARWLREPGSAPRMPALTCGIAPLAAPTFALGFIAQLATLVPGLQPLAAALQEETWLNVAVDVAVVTVLAVLLARLFCPPAAVVAAFRRAALPDGANGDVGGALRRASRRSVALVVVVALVPTLAVLLGTTLRLSGSSLVAVAIVLAVAADLRAEARARALTPALTCARPFHRVYAVAPALDALAAAGISAFARAMHYRGLFHFFAPWAPVEILVPPERVDEAAVICARVEVG